MAKAKPEVKKAWKKSGGGFGPLSRLAATKGAGEPARLTPQERATKEISRYQKDGGYLIPRTKFIHLTREIFNKVTQGTRVVHMQQSAIKGLQIMAEAHVALAFNSELSFNWHIALSYYVLNY